MKTYFDAVCELVGTENVGLGPSAGPLDKIVFADGFTDLPTEEQIQAKLAELQAAEPMRQLRIQRDQLLSATDWWCVSDRTPTAEQLQYRQALRDLPANCTPALDEDGNLTGVTWPNKPE